MDFSVLMSVYYKERPDFFRQSLESIFTQTHCAKQVVLVEDGPLTQELDTVVTEYKGKYPNLTVVALSKNQGLGKALNEGLKYCNYDLVARMDADDISKPFRFEKQLVFMEKHPEIDVVSSWIEEFDGDINNVTCMRRVPEKSEEIYEYCKGRCPVNHPAVMFRKKSVLRVGGYLTTYFPEDYFLWIRMLMNGSKFYNIQESLLYFRYTPDTIKKRGGWKYAIGEIHIQKMIYDLGFITFVQFVKNSALRFITRVLPLKQRTWIYNHLLRTTVRKKTIYDV